MSAPTLLAQVTDTHLLAATAATLRGCHPWDTLNTVLRAAMGCHPTGLLLTGDLAEQGEAEAYGHLVEALSPLELPVYWLPGNHDHLPTLRQAFKTLSTAQGLTSVDLGAWQLILLDSVLPQATWGEGILYEDQLHQLQHQLQQCLHKPTLIALHHHPVAVGIDWIDQMQVQNPRSFLDLLDRFTQVKLVVFGHIHHEFQQTIGGVNFYGSPSTCFQVTSQDHGVTEKRPGFRLIWLYDDGHHRTEVRRIGIKSPH